MSTDTEPVALPTGAAARFVGTRMPRTEDQRMITGHGRYVDDLSRRGTAHVAFVRSSVAAGRIISIDATEARQLPGVFAVLTAAEINPLVNVVNAPGDPTPRNVLADGTVRFVGDPIAMVLAESRYLAEDAAELISVDIEPGEAVVTAEQALAEGSPRVHAELTDNAAGVLPAADNAELDAIIENAAHVFTETFAQHRYVNVPMETRGLIAEWDTGAKKLEVVLACQGVHDVRAFYARMLGLPADDIRVTMGDVGGSFGQKAFPTRDEQAVVAAAMIVGDRPIKWIEDRSENLISAGHARQESLRITAATDERGVLLAAKAHHTENVGSYPTGSNGQMAGLSSLVFPGPYHWSGPGSVAYSGQAAYTNTCGQCAYRGPWMMETTGREQMVEVIAHRLGIDPLEFRRRNVLSRSELPYTNPMTLVYDGVSPEECLEQAATLIGYEQFRKDQEAARAEGRLLGVGLSLYIEPQPSGGNGGTAAATIRIEPSGKVNVYMGTGSHGQGIETTMTQIVADEMGVNIEDVHFVQGDTDSTPYGFLTGGSLTAGVSGGAAHQAGAAMKERVLAVAGQMMEIDPGDLEMTESVARIKGDPEGKSVTLAEIAAAAYMFNPGGAAARVRGRPGDFQAVSGTDLDVLQRLPRGHRRDRPGDRDGAHPALRHLRRLRRDDQPQHRRGADRRRGGAGHRRGVLRALPLRRRGQPDHDHVHGLPAAHRGRGPGPGVRPRGHPGPEPGRAQGTGRGRRHRRPGRAAERGPGCAVPARDRVLRPAAVPGPHHGAHRRSRAAVS